jgi:lipid A 3-O-deacylase
MLVATGLFAPGAARAAGTAVVGLGVFGVRPGDKHVALLDLEYRFTPWRHLFGVGPVVGAAVNSEGGGYVRAGFFRDFTFGDWNADISSAASDYFAGSGKKLGLPLEFRSALDLSYRLREDLRLGVAVAHLSNASFAEHNPGVETLTLTVAWTPGGRLGGR